MRSFGRRRERRARAVVAVTQARAAAAARRRRPRLRCYCCCCRDGVELSNAEDRAAVAARPRASRRARELAVSLLAGCCRPLGPAAAEGAGPPQAPWASVGHTTPTVSTVCVRMVCVSMCVSTPSRNLASPETATYCYAIHRRLELLDSGGSGGSGKTLVLAAPPVAGSRARESRRPAGRRIPACQDRPRAACAAARPAEAAGVTPYAGRVGARAAHRRRCGGAARRARGAAQLRGASSARAQERHRCCVSSRVVGDDPCAPSRSLYYGLAQVWSVRGTPSRGGGPGSSSLLRGREGRRRRQERRCGLVWFWEARRVRTGNVYVRDPLSCVHRECICVHSRVPFAICVAQGGRVWVDPGGDSSAPSRWRTAVWLVTALRGIARCLGAHRECICAYTHR